MNCEDRRALENLKTIVILCCVAAIIAILLVGCDDRKCRDGTANEFQRIVCP
jgi:hypothetical protein